MSCKKQCTKNIVESRRLEIHKQFWTLSNDDQKNFIFSCITKTNTKRKTVEGESRRNKTMIYALPDPNGCKNEMCKIFFLSTLGFRAHNNKIIRNTFSRDSSDAFVVKLLDKYISRMLQTKLPKILQSQLICIRQLFPANNVVLVTIIYIFSFQVLMLPRCDTYYYYFYAYTCRLQRKLCPCGEPPTAVLQHDAIQGRLKKILLALSTNTFFLFET